MANYSLPIFDGITDRRVPLTVNSRMEIYDELGVAHEIINTPDALPPVGEWPVGIFPVPFTLDSPVTYLDVRTTIATRFSSLVSGLLVQYENFPTSSAGADLEALFFLDWDETVNVQEGASYEDRISGSFVITFTEYAQSGVSRIHGKVDEVADLFRNLEQDGIVYKVPYTRPARRLGSKYSLELFCPFVVRRDLPRVVESVGSVLNFEAAGNAVRTRYQTLIENTGPLLVTQYDNFPSISIPPSGIWATASINPTASFQLEAGTDTATFRHLGFLSVQLFTPLGSGVKTQLEIADTIDDAFRSVSAGGITYRVPILRRIGHASSAGGAFWQFNIDCPFTFQQA